MTRLLVSLALFTGFVLIFYLTFVIGREPPLGEGWYLIGPVA